MKIRCLVVSYAIPSRTTGTPVVIRNLLENFSADEIVLIGRPVKKSEKISDYHPKYPIYEIPTPTVETSGERVWRIVSLLLGIVIGLQAIRKHKLTSILVFYRDYSSLLTGYYLHKITGLPLYSYFCDLYLENYPKGFYHKLAKWLQLRIFKSSTRVFVVTESIQDYFMRNYNICSTVLPHCVNRIPINNNYSPKLTYPIKIGYLGDINADRMQSLKLLCNVIEGDSKYELNYFTAKTEKYLRNEGLLIPNSKRAFIHDNDELLLELGKCNILYLPVMQSSDHEERKEQAFTGFPTKTLEYLLCNKPILLHGHREYYSATFCERYNCCYIEDGGSDALKTALDHLIGDEDLRKELTKNTTRALAYFDGSKVANTFRNELMKN